MRRRALLLAAFVLSLVFPASSLAATALEEGFESGLNGWTADGLWHVQSNPQAFAVHPAVNPALVTLPDSGALPAAHSGTGVAWFGDSSSGTFCGDGTYVSSGQVAKNGCESATVQEGSLTSPSFSLLGALGAQVEFWAWWEIEGVDADSFDLMTVEYSTDGGSNWSEAGKLNPSDDADAAHDEPYTANGVRQPGSWHRYVADISAAAGSASVAIRFHFDSEDKNYQGFRGWLVDDVSVQTPYSEPAPRVDLVVPGCVPTGESRIVAVLGDHFVLGSKVKLNGAEVASATPSSTRMEFVAPDDLPEGLHSVQVVREGANAAASNAAELRVRADCESRRRTATELRCDRGPNPYDPSRCTATVGDADIPTRKTPYGNVTLSSADGAFSSTYGCALVPTPLSPGVASCTVDNVPAGKDGFASVRADYAGSDVHLPSTATTGFILAAGSGQPGTDCDGPPTGKASSRPGAGISVVNDYYTFNQPGLDFGDIGFCFTNLAIDGAQGMTYLVKGAAYAAPPVTGAVVLVTEPGPPQMKIAGAGAATGLVYYVSIPVKEGAESVYKSLETAQKDPPDPNFKRFAKPRRERVPRLVPGGALTRKQAKRLHTAATGIAWTGALADALSATIDRAGGAEKAGNQKWQGRQMAYALKLARRLAKQLYRSAKDVARAGRAAKGLPALTRKFNLKQMKRDARRTLKRGFTKSQKRLLRALGTDKRGLRQIRKAQKEVLTLKSAKQLPVRKPVQLYGKRTVRSLRTAALALRYWVALPEVYQQAKLGRG